MMSHRPRRSALLASSAFAVVLSAWAADLDSGFGTQGAVALNLAGASARAASSRCSWTARSSRQDSLQRSIRRSAVSRRRQCQLATWSLRATTRTAPSIRRSAKGGVVRIDFAGRDDRANGIAVQGDGAIGVAGTTEVAAGDFDVAIARLTPSGVLDTAFDTDGRVTIAFGRNQDEAADVEVQSDGRIVFSGYSGTLNASNSS